MENSNTVNSKVYTVSDIQKILLISKSSAYNFIKSNPPFNVFKVGDTYRISKKSFDDRLSQFDN